MDEHVEEQVEEEHVVVAIVGEGSGAVATVSLIGVSKRVREQFLFLIFEYREHTPRFPFYSIMCN